VLTTTISSDTLSIILRVIEMFFSRNPKVSLDIMMEIAKRAKALCLSFLCADEATKGSVRKILNMSENIPSANMERMKHLLSCWGVH
jgi:hypothetical protein